MADGDIYCPIKLWLLVGAALVVTFYVGLRQDAEGVITVSAILLLLVMPAWFLLMGSDMLEGEIA